MTNTRNYLLNGLKTELSDLKINSIETSSTNGKERFCAPSILNVSFLGTRGEVILHTLEQDNIFVSTGEMITQKQIYLIESVFSARVANRYGACEFGVMAQELYRVVK